ncbi:formimidoylglutamate deiminase [Salinifilum ghardaiensis]
MPTFWCEWAWLPGGPRRSTVCEVDQGRIVSVRPEAPAPEGAEPLHGLVLPGLANAHSHAFQRALRGRTGAAAAFGTWRETMHHLAGQLDPDSYHRLARGAFAEMALAGFTSVGEFHYLHHAPGGRRYADPNAMGEALIAAARETGIRLTLLDTCYLRGDFDGELGEAQRRFADADVQAWLDRIDRISTDGRTVRLAAAVHSVRAVPPAAIRSVAAWAEETDSPLHVHVSEQRSENKDCLTACGRTPTRVLSDAGALGPHVTAVHATHVTDADIALLGSSGTTVCLCPTTEADLAGGMGSAEALSAAGAPLCLGSDANTVIDPFLEARTVEGLQRLRHETRGHFATTELLAAIGENGHRSLGWLDVGWLEVGARADFVVLELGVRHAGVPVAEVPAVARGDDVRHVYVDGRCVVRGGQHRHVPDVAGALSEAVGSLFDGPG